jgi:flagellar basal-body rod modification protein FlgD
MDINALYSISGNTQNTTTSSNGLDKNAFLKILMAQLSNQDPMSNQDNSQYIAQMAQFSALEQSQNTNASLEKMLVSQRVTEGSMMIGKEVAIVVDDETYVTELVKGLIIENSQVFLKTENGVYSIDRVIGVGDFEDDQQSSTTIKD